MFQIQPPSITEVADALNWFQRHTGWGWTFSLVAIVVLGGGWLLFWWKKYRPLQPAARNPYRGMRVFTDRAQLSKAVGTLDEELKSADRVWVLWPCGTAIPGLKEASVKKIERAIFTDVRKPTDFAPIF